MKKYSTLALLFLLAFTRTGSAQDYTQQVTAIQYYFNTDPGAGTPGNGGVIPVTPAGSISQAFDLSLPALPDGINYLYVRAKDEFGKWSVAERRTFFISEGLISEDITAIEYYFNNDPGPGNGTVVAVGPASSYSGSLTIALPGGLNPGFHNLYIRTKDSGGTWSVAERRLFYISENLNPQYITSVEYYFDNDPGPGSGTVVTVGPASSYSGSLTIALPGGLDPGIHNLYIRTKDSGGTWSVAERRPFYINAPSPVEDLVALEYYYDNDPGPGNANPVDISDGTVFSGAVALGMPCLSEGTHYLYLRAMNQSGSWSVIGRDTLSVTGGIDPTVISPAGPLSFCPTDSVTLSFESIPGVTYQWQKDASDISGATSSSLTITEAGSYQVKAYCGPVFSISNVVEVSVLPLLTFYADVDNDGFGDIANDSLDCSQPLGYVSNSDDCDDTDENINPAAAEVCNGIDEDCDDLIDEGVLTTFYADADMDGYGDPFMTVTGCTLPAGYVENNQDCDDSDENINPLATELCNGIDDNCDGNIDEGFVYSVAGASVSSSEGENFCFGTTSYLSLTGGILGTGAIWVWYEGSCGIGDPVGAGETIPVTPSAGSHTYYVRAEGICNISDCISIEITVGDTEEPVISGCPSNITLETEEGQWGASVSWTPPTATDNCSEVTLVSNYEPGHFFNVGTTVVTYTATDGDGNSSSCQFLITVTPPDLLGTVNITVISSDITFSDNDPEPGISMNVNALIRNNSNIDAGSFTVQFTDLFTNTAYPQITVAGLNAGQSILVNEFISTPNVPAFVPIQVSIDVTNDLDESSEYDNSAVRPFICGDIALPGEVDILTSASPATVTAGSFIHICGSANYDTSPPLNDPSVAGAEVIITIVETGEQFGGYTDEDGNFCISYRTPNTPGEYHFTVDVTDDVLSGDASGTFTLNEPEYTCPKDLTVSINLTGISPSGSGSFILATGTSFSGTVHVRNNCTAIAEQTTLYIAPPAGTIPPYEVNIPALSPGEDYPVSLPSFTLSSVGDFFISATVDYDDIITDEASETNNTDYKVLIILPPLPDIVAAGGGVLSDLQCFGNNQVNFLVRNTGLAPTGMFTSVFSLYINEIFHSNHSQVISNLNPGDITILSFPFPVTSITDTLRFKLEADLPDIVDELSEFNNVYSFEKIFLECLPDLVVLGCDFTDVKPVDPMPDGTVTVTATVRNQGEIAISEPFDVTFNIAGTLVTETVTGPLASQQSTTLSVSAPIPVDACATLTVTADSEGIITEHLEGNNSYSAPLCYDFEFTNIDCFGYTIFSGTQNFCSPGVFRIGFYNFGSYEASDFEVRFEISGPGLDGWILLGTESTYAGNSCECPSSIGYSGTFYFPQTGTYLVRMTADPDNLYLESDETNNQVIQGLNVVESADYEVLSSYIFPSKINPDLNEAISFSVSYTNTGCTGFSPIELYAMMDNDPLDSLIVSPLPSGGWNNVAIPNTWSSSVPGVHVFRAIIDHDENIAEGNEMNNEATKAIFVGGAPDYNVLFVSVTDDTPEAGQLITLSADVMNEGQSTGSGLLQFLHADGSGTENLIIEEPVSILPGMSGSFSAPWITTDPHARIIARVVNVLPLEFDLSDNEKETQLNNLMVSLAATDVLCHGDNSGMITLDVEGGTPPFNIVWSDPSLFGSTVIVFAGTYSVIVTDYDGLSASDTITVAEPEALVLTDNHTDASCDNLSDGSVDLSVSGGISPYSFSWSNGETTEDLTGLAAGTYNVLVSDANNCSATLSVTIASLANATTWYQDADNDSYGNESAIMMSCAQPTGYVDTPGDCDDNNPTVNPAATEVCDNNIDDNCNGFIDEGCETSCDISVEAGSDVTTYFGIISMQTVSRTAVVTGGTAPFSFSWTLGRPMLCNQENSAGDEAFYGGTCQDNTCPTYGSPVNTATCTGDAIITATLLDTALVCVTVTDINGCTATDCFYVNASDIRCFAGNSGNHKVKMCHSTNSQNNPWVEICVDTNSIDTHLAHGDYLGLCDWAKESEVEGTTDGHHDLHFHLYPNPASKKATLEFISLTESNYRVEIVNMTGLTVYREEGKAIAGENTRILSFPGYARGLYLVRLNVEGSQIVEKLIIE